jgi:hypothetical protein
MSASIAEQESENEVAAEGRREGGDQPTDHAASEEEKKEKIADSLSGSGRDGLINRENGK